MFTDHWTLCTRVISACINESRYTRTNCGINLMDNPIWFLRFHNKPSNLNYWGCLVSPDVSILKPKPSATLTSVNLWIVVMSNCLKRRNWTLSVNLFLIAILKMPLVKATHKAQQWRKNGARRSGVMKNAMIISQKETTSVPVREDPITFQASSSHNILCCSALTARPFPQMMKSWWSLVWNVIFLPHFIRMRQLNCMRRCFI